MACGGPGACLFERAHQMWIAGDFEGFLGLFDEDIVWIVNIDGLNVPYASSALGKVDLRWRLQHMMDTFRIARFDVETIEHGAETCRSTVHLNYVHKATAEPLDVKVRFTGWARNGLLSRFEERADAAYVEAFSRFVRYLESTSLHGG